HPQIAYEPGAKQYIEPTPAYEGEKNKNKGQRKHGPFKHVQSVEVGAFCSRGAVPKQEAAKGGEQYDTRNGIYREDSDESNDEPPDAAQQARWTITGSEIRGVRPGLHRSISSSECQRVGALSTLCNTR